MAFYTDIHCHIMPGVDDGAQELEQSLAMLKIAEREKIRKIILTPHQKPERRCVSVAGIEKRTAQLQELLRRKKIDIELYPGSELFYRLGLRDMLAEGSVCTLANSHYVLVEFMPDEEWTYIRDAMYRLVSWGYWPIAAHVERYAQVVKDLDRVEELIDMGCYMQLNTGSIMGDWGFSAKLLTRKLLKNNMVHFLGTDAHRDSGKRAPSMEKCANWLLKKDEKYAQRLLWENAESIFADAEL